MSNITIDLTGFWPREKTDTVLKSPPLKDGLYDISVDVNMTIHWLQPPENASENIMRDHRQNLLDERAYKFAQEIRRKLKEHGFITVS